MDTFACSICGMCRYRHQVLAVPKFAFPNNKWIGAIGIENYWRIERQKNPVACIEHFAEREGINEPVPLKIADGEAKFIDNHFHDHGYSRLSKDWSESVGRATQTTYLFCSICGKQVQRSAISRHCFVHVNRQPSPNLQSTHCPVHYFFLDDARTKRPLRDCADCAERRKRILKTQLQQQISACFGLHCSASCLLVNYSRQVGASKRMPKARKAPKQQKKKVVRGWFLKNPTGIMAQQKFHISDETRKRKQEIERGAKPRVQIVSEGDEMKSELTASHPQLFQKIASKFQTSSISENSNFAQGTSYSPIVEQQYFSGDVEQFPVDIVKKEPEEGQSSGFINPEDVKTEGEWMKSEFEWEHEGEGGHSPAGAIASCSFSHDHSYPNNMMADQIKEEDF